MARIGFIQHRAKLDRNRELTYQRLVSKKRLKDISAYINEDLVFPTNLVINFRGGPKLLFNQAEKTLQPSGDLTFGTLTLPNTFKSAWIIDGQHRLFSYFHKDTKSKYRTRPQLPVVAFVNLDHVDEANLFIDINSKQVKVARNLLLEVNAELNIDSPIARQRLYAFASRIVLELNGDRNSVLHDKIKTERGKEDKGFISLPQLVEGLVNSSLIATVDSKANVLVPGPLYGDQNPASTIDRSVKVLSAFLGYFRVGAQQHWNHKNKLNRPEDPGGHLCTSLGVSTLILLLDDLVKYVESTLNIDCREIEPGELVSYVEGKCRHIIEFFQNPSYDDILRFRIHRGSTASHNGMREMQVIIRAADSLFDRPGLDEYILKQEQRQVEDLRAIYSPLENDLLQIVLRYLKSKFGEEVDGWFIKGTPANVQKRLLEERNKPGNSGRDLEQCFKMPLDGKLIMECYSADFQALLKAPDLKWMSELINIRDEISHAPYHIEPSWKGYLTETIIPMLDRAKKQLSIVS